MLDQITPLILTYNESPNIGRNLDRLKWAKDVVIVDSYSQDDTRQLAESYSNVKFFQRVFDNHSNQWNFGLNETNITTEWVLALDADYILPPEFCRELQSLNAPPEVSAYRASFRYCVMGKRIRGSLYPPGTVLFRKSTAQYRQDGHTQRLQVTGGVQALASSIDHDDRKPLEGWLKAQHRYCKLEAQKLKRATKAELGWPDRIRKGVYFAPVLVPLYCLFLKGNILDGSAGIYYASQRGISELLLSLFLMENDSKPNAEYRAS